MVRLTFLDERAAGVGDSQSEFHKRKGFESGAYFVVLAREGQRMVGAFRAFTEVTPGTIHAGGTWVDPEHRGTGLALRLWARMIRELRPGTVVVTTISRGGARLVKALKKRHPKLKWEHKK